MKKPLIALAVLAVLTLAMVSPAAAAKPSVQAIHTELSGFVLEDCGDFQILLDLTHDETITTFLDQFNLPTSSTIRFTFAGTLTNSVTGKIALEHGASTLFIDSSGEEGHQAGLILSIVVPGQGVALLEVAEVEFDGSAHASLSGGPSIPDDDSFLCSLLR